MGRNVNGEGNIRQRSDGRWEGRAYVVTTDDREIRRSVYGKTWQEAHDKLTKLQADTMSGKRVASSRQTVAEYLDYWLHDVVRHRVRDTTYEGYEYVVRVYLKPLFGKRRLTALRRSDIRRAFYKLRQTCQCCAQGKDAARKEPRCCARTPPECCGQVVEDGTILIIRRRLRTALQDAIRDDLLSENAAADLGMKFATSTRGEAWAADEARRFLKVANKHRLGAVFTVALLLGLRRGEALGLSWRDVDLDHGVVRVTQSLARVNHHLRLGDVKTTGSAATVAVPEPCIERLREHRRVQETEREKADKKWQDSALVFTTKHGGPIDPRNINHVFAALCEKAGVRQIKFHGLRHSCGTMLYEMGVPIEHIQDVLRHANPTITKTLYVDTTEKVQRAAVDKLGNLLDGDANG